tara:strand:- start:359 stop:676 length:318 start_codon:yes stop_codon:yes gene_type:complete
MDEEDTDNVIPLHPNKPNIYLDLNIEEDDVDTHQYVLKYMDKVQEEIRNNPSVNGAFVLTFADDGQTDNWIMGDIKVALLYTALASIQNELLKVFNGAEETTFRE